MISVSAPSRYRILRTTYAILMLEAQEVSLMQLQLTMRIDFVTESDTTSQTGSVVPKRSSWRRKWMVRVRMRMLSMLDSPTSVMNGRVGGQAISPGITRGTTIWGITCSRSDARQLPENRFVLFFLPCFVLQDVEESDEFMFWFLFLVTFSFFFMYLHLISQERFLGIGIWAVIFWILWFSVWHSV